MNKENLNKDFVAASLMAVSAFTGGQRYSPAKHSTKKQSKSRSKNKAAKQARKKNRR